MESGLDRYFKKLAKMENEMPVVAYPKLTGENARAVLPNAEDMRYLRSGANGIPLYVPPQTVEPVQVQPSRLTQLKEYFNTMKNNILQSSDRPVAIPERELTPEEELKINSQGGQLRILNKQKPWGPVYK